MKIKLHKSKDNQFYFTVNARNNHVLLTSETYKRRSSMVKTAMKVAAGMINIQALQYSINKQLEKL